MKTLTKNIFVFVAGFIFCLISVTIGFIIFLSRKRKSMKRDFGNFDELMKQAKDFANIFQQKNVDISDEKINSILKRFPATEIKKSNKKAPNK
jgi:UPF0716 family protein affecting phage T7 exclusion